MKALCITGADNTTLADIAAPFYQAGMKRPKPLQRESTIDFARWHQQVNGTLANNQPMGKLWENMATDLILANLESDCWGWYEADSVYALDFWAELEPNIHFLLVCTRPEQELADKMAHTQPDAEAHRWLEQWHQRHQTMLDFYLKNPERCILVDAVDARQHLNGQLALAHEHWQLPLDAAPVEDHEPGEQSTQAEQPGSHLASLIVRELIKNSKKDITGLYAEMQAAQYPFNQDDTAEPASSQLMNWLRADIDAPMLQKLLTDFHTLHSTASQSQRLLTLQHDQSAEAERLAQELKQQLTEGKDENELLLLQLHQVQEELESTFLAKQELEQKLKDAKTQGASATRVKELEQALQQSQQANHQAQAAPQQIQQQKTEAEAAHKQLEDAQQENELLLLQLHQVQEELEHYFLEHQNRQKEITELQQKLDRFKRQGNSVYSAAQVSETDSGQVNWVLNDAQLGGEEWPQLHIKGQSSLTRTELTVNTGEPGTPWTLSTQTEGKNLTNAQWALAEALPKALQCTLEHAPLSPRQKKRWHKALEKLQHHLNAQPPRLVYKAVRLKREQVNPDYEHLWLTLEQPSFNQTHLDSWSFRISCAGITPNEFGNQPKLEFPDQEAQLLESWFQESQDHFGNKLELRFALPNAMDMGVWKRLDPKDQNLLKALVQQLPAILADLEQQGRRLERPWEDWQKLIADIQRIHTAKTAK
ncbi:MAG: hypothetical protein LAT66_04235 [Alkalimonas sp.]|nr:hypothetical protein [Saccharospirillum sp.]MCH8536962.1 hypothetical protein [Alkalimonas sp.]